eukprot:jgi/Mesvir1/11135/Mv02914-RA.1
MSFQKSEIEATGQTVGLFYLGLTETNFDMFRLSVNVAWFAGAPGTIKLTLPADLAPVDAEGFSNERVYDITIDKSGVSVTVAAGTITLYLPVGVLDAAGDTNADTWVTVDFLQATPYQPSIQVSTRAPDQGAVKYMKADITFPRDVTGFASDSIKIRQQAPESAKGWKFELGDECPCLTRGLFTGVEFCLEFDLDTTEVPKGSLNVAVEEGAATDADDKASSANNTTIEYPEPLQFSLAFQDVVGRAVDPLDDGLQNWFQMVVTWDRSVSGFQTSGFQVKYFRTGVTPIEVSVAKITPASGSGANYTLLFDKTETAGSNDGFITLYVPRRAVVDALSSNVYNSYDTRYQVQFVHAESPFLDPSLFQATFTDEVTAEKIPLTVQSAVPVTSSVYDLYIARGAIPATVKEGMIKLFLPAGSLTTVGEDNTNADTQWNLRFTQPTPYYPTITISRREPDTAWDMLLKVDVSFPRDVTGFTADAIKFRVADPDPTKQWDYDYQALMDGLFASKGAFTALDARNYRLEFNYSPARVMVPVGQLNVYIEEGAALDANERPSAAHNNTLSYTFQEPLQMYLSFQDSNGAPVDPVGNGLKNVFKMVVTWTRSVAGFQDSGFVAKFLRLGEAPASVPVTGISPVDGSGTTYTLTLDKTAVAGTNSGFIGLEVPAGTVAGENDPADLNPYRIRWYGFSYSA